MNRTQSSSVLTQPQDSLINPRDGMFSLRKQTQSEESAEKKPSKHQLGF